jgi:lipopolysaccharide biosynthesis protein
MRLIAYYLPQYHTIPENDEWWGPGFTEWTNVRNAKSLFKGHYQPIVPADLGYYNLLDPEIREKQANMARESGIEAFCYWHYWFGNGRQLLDKPFKEVLSSGNPDFPFCLGWANETWKAKVWSRSNDKRDRILIEQLYPGKKDIVDHFYSLLEAFHDNRYIKINGRPIFVIYKPLVLPEVRNYIEIWNNLAIKEGFSSGLFLIGHTNISHGMMNILDLGFDAVNVVRIGDCLRDKLFLTRNIASLIRNKLLDKPLIIDYKDATRIFSKNIDTAVKIFPSIIPNWDHTPRSSTKGMVLHGSTPDLFGQHVREVFETVKDKPKEYQIVFIKSWNEWGEGNYLEPDARYGTKYLKVMRDLLKQY